MSRALGDAHVQPARGLPGWLLLNKGVGWGRPWGPEDQKEGETHLPAKVPAGQIEELSLGDGGVERPIGS